MRASPERPVGGEPGAPPLWRPEEPFPPYRFVPGQAPHPFAHAAGWAYGRRPEDPPYVPAADWRDNPAFLHGVDLFNRGWWWEAHETWEGCWRSCTGRDEQQRALLQGLIQVAACALQRERGADGGADKLLDSALGWLGRARAAGGRPCDLDLDDFCAEVRRRLTPPSSRVDGLYLRPGS